jgi:hypothetical protein
MIIEILRMVCLNTTLEALFVHSKVSKSITLSCNANNERSRLCWLCFVRYRRGILRLVLVMSNSIETLDMMLHCHNLSVQLSNKLNIVSNVRQLIFMACRAFGDFQSAKLSRLTIQNLSSTSISKPPD